MGGNDTQRRWTKQDEEDATRLLEELAKRSNKASGGFQKPERIQKPGASLPGSAEGSADGFGARHPRQQPVGLAGEKATDAGEEPASASSALRREGTQLSLELKSDNDNGRERGALMGLSPTLAGAVCFTARLEW